MDGKTAHRSRADDHPAPRRRWLIVLVVVIVLGAATGAAALGLGGRHRPVAQAKVTLTNTAVTRCTLTDSQVFPGQTTFGAARPVPVQSQGLITWLPKAGTVVSEGQTLVRVNDRPVVLLHGSLPQYRALNAPAAQTTTAVTDGAKTSTPATPTGPTAGRPMREADVRQLKRALTRLGYRGLGTGQDYTRSTAEVVKRWQRDLGQNRPVPSNSAMCSMPVGRFVWCPDPRLRSASRCRPPPCNVRAAPWRSLRRWTARRRGFGPE